MEGNLPARSRPNKTHKHAQIIVSVLGICAGTALASYGELNFSALGILIMLGAEVTEGIRLVLVQYLLKVSKQ